MLIAVSRGRGQVRRKMAQVPANALLLSPIVLGELEFGAEKSAYGERSRPILTETAELLEFVPLDWETARCYGRIRAELERRGTPIGSNDTWIAAQALALGAILVTDKEREFSRVPGLKIENWLKG